MASRTAKINQLLIDEWDQTSKCIYVLRRINESMRTWLGEEDEGEANPEVEEGGRRRPPRASRAGGRGARGAGDTGRGQRACTGIPGRRAGQFNMEAAAVW